MRDGEEEPSGENHGMDSEIISPNNNMNAESARRNSSSNRNKGKTEPLIELVYKEIREAVHHGERSVSIPNFGRKPGRFSVCEQEVLNLLIDKDGYGITTMTGSSDVEISWD